MNLFAHNFSSFSFLQQSPSWTDSSLLSANKIERIFTTLLREAQSGSLGFSISGGKGAEQYYEGDSSVYISKVAEGGPAHRDGKIQKDDKLVQVRFYTVYELRKFTLTAFCYKNYAKLSD